MFASLFRLAYSDNKVTLTTNWWKIVQKWYPNLHHRVYLVPPLHFNAVSYKQTTAQPEPYERAGFHMMIPTQYSCVRDDEAQQRVLFTLSAFFRSSQGPAFILTNVEFQNYLNKYCATEDADTNKHHEMPRVRDVDEGEADILIIDKQGSIFVLENKSTGNSVRVPPLTEKEQLEELRGPLQKISKQLKKNKEVVNRLMSDLNINGGIKIRAGFLLPNISRDLLTKACREHLDVVEELMSSVEVSEIKDLLECCLCSEDLPPANVRGEETIPDHILVRVGQYFSRLRPLPEGMQMLDDVYEQIVARFCGPLTTVKIYTERNMPRVRLETIPSKRNQRRRRPKQEKVKVVAFECRTATGAAREIARRFSELVLLPEQIAILQQPKDFVHLEGPPGSGKTLMLLLRTLMLLDGNNMVCILSLAASSRSVTHVLYEQVTMMLVNHKGQEEAKKIIAEKLRCCIVSRPESARNDQYFKEKLHKWRCRAMGCDHERDYGDCDRLHTWHDRPPRDGKKMCVVLDETGLAPECSEIFFRRVGKCCREGCFRWTGVSVWSASVERCGRPSYVSGDQQTFGLLQTLSMSLRCPPSVQRLAMLVQPLLKQDVCQFRKEFLLPHPAPIQSLYNTTGEGWFQSHADGMPVHLIAHGSHKAAEGAIWDCGECALHIANYLQNCLGIRNPRKRVDGECVLPDIPLTWSDVVIVATQKAYTAIIETGEFFKTMAVRDFTISVAPTREESCEAIPKEDEILVTDLNSMHGLERAIVIFVPGNPETSPAVKDTVRSYAVSGQCHSEKLQTVTAPGRMIHQQENRNSYTMQKFSRPAGSGVMVGDTPYDPPLHLAEPMEVDNESLRLVKTRPNFRDSRLGVIRTHKDTVSMETEEASSTNYTPLGPPAKMQRNNLDAEDLTCDCEEDLGIDNKYEFSVRQAGPQDVSTNALSRRAFLETDESQKPQESRVDVENLDVFSHSGSFSNGQIEAALLTLSEEARQDLFYIASRAVSQLIIIHFGRDHT